MDGWMYVRTYLDSRDTGGNSLDETPVVRDLLLTSVISDPNATALLIWKWCKKKRTNPSFTRCYQRKMYTMKRKIQDRERGAGGRRRKKKKGIKVLLFLER